MKRGLDDVLPLIYFEKIVYNEWGWERDSLFIS